MGRVNVKYKQQNGTIKEDNHQISKIRLASCYFRIQRVKWYIPHIFTSLGKAIIIYNLLENYNGYFIKSNEYTGTDPSEKGNYSYYLGMATCKWVSEELFHVPHLQYFSLTKKSPMPRINTINSKSPDLVGKDKNGQFLLFEAKGTCGKFNKYQIIEGKQKMQGVTIFGNTPNGIVTESYFNKDKFSIYAEDPKFDETTDCEYDDSLVVKNYYHNIISLLTLQKENIDDKYVFNYSTYLNELQIKVQVGLDKRIYGLYKHHEYERIHSLVTEGFEAKERENEFISPDGISFKIIWF